MARKLLIMLDKAAIVVVLIALIGERPAHAYIDPGAGSLIYQTALTALLGLVYMLGRGRASISRVVKRLGGRQVTPEQGVESRD
jgi:hypothetical protein